MLTKALVMGVGVLALSLGTAQAKKYTIEVTPNNDTCYSVNYVPATYLVNTMGKKLRGERKEWVGEIVAGGTVIHRRVPAAYFETRKLVEADHYSLVPSDC